MINNNDEVLALLRLDAAVRALRYALYTLPAEKRSPEVNNKICAEIREALSQIDTVRGDEWKFDEEASFEYIINKQERNYTPTKPIFFGP